MSQIFTTITMKAILYTMVRSEKIQLAVMTHLPNSTLGLKTTYECPYVSKFHPEHPFTTRHHSFLPSSLHTEIVVVVAVAWLD